MNAYREVCSLYFDYIEYTCLVADVIPTVSNFAANYAQELIREIKEIVKQDIEAKYVEISTLYTGNRQINSIYAEIFFKF